ncbi:hypothetical protein [Nocardia sp. NPDC050717]|uniref:hypothetical protein n=1 Tax=Nocardia sp. NPDC050717 TaxID=3157221 RepID=UPI0034073F0B
MVEYEPPGIPGGGENVRNWRHPEIVAAFAPLEVTGAVAQADCFALIAHRWEEGVSAFARAMRDAQAPWSGAAAAAANAALTAYLAEARDLSTALVELSGVVRAAAEAIVATRYAIPALVTTGIGDGAAEYGAQERALETARTAMHERYVLPFGAVDRRIPVLPMPTRRVATLPEEREASGAEERQPRGALTGSTNSRLTAADRTDVGHGGTQRPNDDRGSTERPNDSGGNGNHPQHASRDPKDDEASERPRSADADSQDLSAAVGGGSGDLGVQGGQSPEQGVGESVVRTVSSNAGVAPLSAPASGFGLPGGTAPLPSASTEPGSGWFGERPERHDLSPDARQAVRDGGTSATGSADRAWAGGSRYQPSPPSDALEPGIGRSVAGAAGPVIGANPASTVSAPRILDRLFHFGVPPGGGQAPDPEHERALPDYLITTANTEALLGDRRPTVTGGVIGGVPPAPDGEQRSASARV